MIVYLQIPEEGGRQIFPLARAPKDGELAERHGHFVAALQDTGSFLYRLNMLCVLHMAWGFWLQNYHMKVFFSEPCFTQNEEVVSAMIRGFSVEACKQIVDDFTIPHFESSYQQIQ